MTNTVMIVDQTAIPASLGCETLFVNDTPIMDIDDEYQGAPIEDIASNLAKALGCSVETKHLTGKQLARSMAHKRGQGVTLEALIQRINDSDDLETEYELDDYVQGFSNADVLQAITKPMPVFRAFDIQWDTDSDDTTDLPTELTVAAECEDAVGDMISDLTGYCHLGFNCEQMA